MQDGMTVMSCATPKVGRLRHSHAGTQIDSRYIGVEVVCGPVDTFFLYYMDNLIAGGANIMIEVIRQAQIDLAKLLKTFNLQLPRILHLQFDNCGENKVKTYFTGIISLHFCFILMALCLCFVFIEQDDVLLHQSSGSDWPVR